MRVVRIIPAAALLFMHLIKAGCEGCDEGVVVDDDGEETSTEEPGPECQPPPITFRLDTNHEGFTFEDDVVSVYLTGDFTGWTDHKVELNDSGYGGDEVEGDGIWSVNYLLEREGRYEYMFIVNYLTWVPDPAAAELEETGAAPFTYDNPCTPDIDLVSPPFGEVFEEGEVRVEAYYTDGSLGMGMDPSSVTLILNGEGMDITVDEENGILYTTLSNLPDGKYELILHASDRAGIRSERAGALFFVNSENSPPVARPGFLRFAEVGEEFILDGTMSSDDDLVDSLSFQWSSLSWPGSSEPLLSDYYETSWNGYRLYSGGELIPVPDMEPQRTSSRQVFTPEEEGEYTFSLTLHDGTAFSSNTDNRVKVVAIPPRGESFPSLRLKVYSEEGRVVLDASEYEAESSPDFHWYQDEGNPEQFALSSYIEAGGEILRLPSISTSGNYYFYCLISDSDGYSYPEIAYVYMDDSSTFYGNFNDPPDWVIDAVIYEIYPRRFYEGTFEGIGEKFPYIEELGVDTLWILGPLSSHDHREGYLIKNYFDTEYGYGDLLEFLSFIKGAKEAGFRVIMDININSTSKRHPIFDASRDHTSLFRDWYIWFDDSSSNYGYGREGFAEMSTFENGGMDQPDINLSNPSALRYLLGVFEFYMDPDNDGDPSDGVDGFRITRATGPEHIVWQNLRRILKERNPDVLIYMEEYKGIETIEEYYHHQMDAAATYELYYVYRTIFINEAPPDILFSSLDKIKSTFVYDYARNSSFLENHDVPVDSTIYSDLEEDPERLKCAFALSLSIPSTPLLLYGEELGNPVHLGDMPWDKYTSGSDTFEFFSTILHLRGEYPSMRRGDFYPLETGEYYLFGGGVELDGERVVFAINTSATPLSSAEVDLSASGFVDTSEECLLTDQLSGEVFEKGVGEEGIVLDTGPYEARILEAECD